MKEIIMERRFSPNCMEGENQDEEIFLSLVRAGAER